MDYLSNNLKNSLLLPYDVMKLVFEYVDPLIDIREQIKNKDYDLKEIMYKRMKNFLTKRYITEEQILNLNPELIVVNNIKATILNKYKNVFLFKIYNPTYICGLVSFDMKYKKVLMIEDLIFAGIYKYRKYERIHYNKFKMKNVYKKWLKL
jgi:hypothetical protein